MVTPLFLARMRPDALDIMPSRRSMLSTKNRHFAQSVVLRNSQATSHRFLAEEWPGVEEVRRCAHAMVEEWESGSGNSGQTVRNLSSAGPFWEAVSKWPAEVREAGER